MRIYKSLLALLTLSILTASAKQIKVPEVIFPIEIQAKKLETKPKLQPPDKIQYDEKIHIVIFTKKLPPYPPYDVPPPLGSMKKPKTVLGLPLHKKYLADAIELYDKKDYIFAESTLKKLITKYPNTPEAARGLYFLGMVYYQLKDEEKARKYFELSCETKYDHENKKEACLSAVILNLRTGNFSRAEKYYNMLRTPEYEIDLKFWEAIVDILNNREKEALQKLQKINCTDLEIRTVPYCIYTKAYINLNTGNYEKSLEYALKYLEDVKREEEEARILGKVKSFPYKKHIILITGYDYLNLGKLDEAQEYFGLFLAEYGTADILANYALYGLGLVALKKEKTRDVLKYAGSLETRDKELAQNLYLQLANLYVEKKQFEKALVILHKALGIAPGLKDYIKKKIAVNAYNSGKYQHALNIIKSIKDPLFKLYGGYAAYKLKKYDIAEKFFKEAFEKGNDPIKVEALKYLAEIYYWSNKDPQFLAVVKLLKRYEPEYASNLLGWYYFKKEDYKRAYKYFKDPYMKAVSAFNAGMIEKAYEIVKDKKDRKSLFLKAYIYLKQNKLDERRDILKQLAQGDDEIAVQAAYLYAYSFFSEGKYWQAIKEFKKFVKKYKKHPLARKAILRIADSYYNVGKIEKARKIYEQFLKKFANSPEAVDAAYQLTVLEMKSSSGNVEKQIENFIKKYPDYPFVDLLKLQLAEIYIEKGKFDKAEKIYQELIEKNSKDKEFALYKLGYLYYKKGEIEKAKSTLLRYISTFPKGNFVIPAKELLAKIYEEEGDIDKAVAYYKQLPKTDTHIYKIATLLFKAGRYKEAYEYFLELYSKYPKMRNDIAYFLGKISFKLGEYDKALEYLQEATQATDYRHAAESYYLLAQILKKKGDLEGALNNFLNVIYLYPEAKELVKIARIEASDILSQQNKKYEASCMLKPLLNDENQKIVEMVLVRLKDLPKCVD
ncbi:MAG: tetratricopeptide repeat protein [Aquificae bacterium]|nr:tetratricopeptide repeat protein [Aquificota bacterium]